MAERDLQRLSAALQAFAASTRYNFLKTLQVGRFVHGTPGSLGVVSEFTFEKLVELGTKKLTKLRWLTPEQEEQLTTLLYALGEGDVPPLRSAAEHHQSSAGARESETLDEEPIGSVEIELRLRESLKRIKGSPYFEQLSALPLGKFWDEGWPRAPFEEALSIEQLVELDLSMLMKKRTMSNRRIVCMTKALERALQSVTLPSESRGSQPEVLDVPNLRLVRNEQIEKPLPNMTNHPWMAELEGLPALSRSAIEHFLSVTRAAASSTGRFERLLSSIPDLLTAVDFLELTSTAPISEGLKRRIFPWVASEEFVLGTAMMRSALQSPGTRISTLARAADLDTFSPATAELGCLAVARALGAVEVRIGRRICAGHWTLNPLLAGEIVSSIKRKKGDIEATLVALCPEIDEELRDFLLSSAKSDTFRSRRPRRKIIPH